MQKIRQIVPPKACLACDVCCRFIDKASPWRPVFTKRERDHIDKNLALDKTGKIKLIPYKKLHICPCFSPKENKCKVYALRPFDCRLYPFLLIRRGNKIYLGIDKKCPYTQVIFSEKENELYMQYLKKELSSEEFAHWLKDNPNLFLPAHSDALELAFLFDLS